MEDSNLNLFQNLYPEILREFDPVPKIKVIPYVSNYHYTNFGEFWALARPPFWISKFKRLKIL
jgi:hypothetical protein